MKALKAICAAAVLALSLSIPAYADPIPGIIHMPGGPSSVPEEGCKPSPGDEGCPAVTSTALGDISSQALMDSWWIIVSMF